MDHPQHNPYEPVDPAGREADHFTRPSVSYWQDAWRRLCKDKLAVFGMIFIVFITLAAIFGPLLSPYGYDEADFPP